MVIKKKKKAVFQEDKIIGCEKVFSCLAMKGKNPYKMKDQAQL